MWGVATGGLLGSALFVAVGGAKTFLYVGIFNLVYAVLHVLVQILLNSLRPNQYGGECRHILHTRHLRYHTFAHQVGGSWNRTPTI